MTRPSILLLLTFSLLALPALSQASDLAVAIEANDAQPGLDVQFIVRISWTGSEPPQNVVLDVDLPADIVHFGQWDSAWHCSVGTRSARCTMDLLDAGGSGASFELRVPGAGTYTATAQVSSTTPDPQPQNNQASRSVVVAGLPLLGASAVPVASEPVALEAGESAEMIMGVENTGAAATGVVLRATLPEGGMFTGVDSSSSEPPGLALSCTATADEAVCVIPELPGPGSVTVLVRYVTPARVNGGTFPFVVTVDATQPDYAPAGRTYRRDVVLRRLFTVSTTADEGAGSLRQSMHDANALCANEPCTIRLETGATALQPLSPLPPLRGRIRIDGGEAGAVLDGSLVESGGIYYETGCELTIDRMVIRNFKGHAIEAHQTPEDRSSAACGAGSPFVIPLTVTRTELANNLRGIVTKGISASIAGNVIHGHVRAGIFADGSYYTSIADNEITGNGASGIFINPSDESIYGVPSGADIENNVVRGNGEWGVCRTHKGMVRIQQNSISANLVYGIDVNLDLDTPNRENDLEGVPNKPVLTAAHYDAARDVTIVRGRMDTTPSQNSAVLDFYASPSLSVWGYPEAAAPVRSAYATGAFEIELPGDLRGQWITATHTRMLSTWFAKPPRAVKTDATRGYGAGNTSELSNAVPVL